MSEMHEWLYILKVTRLEMLTEGSTEEEDRIVGEHFQHLKRLLDEGITILMGRTANNDEDTMGLVVFRAENEAEARRIMESDPAISNGVMSATLYPYRVALMEVR
jgi:uncharacterized protein YciI